jgi:Helix-turn-helix domain
MSTDQLDLLLHPVRMRLINAMAGALALTTSDLCAHMPDLPKATVYRHVARLVRGGVFEVVGERRVRGAVERQFRLAREQARIDTETSRSMTLEDHRRGFTAATAALLVEFNHYLDQGGADPVEDGVSYRQGTFWLRRVDIARLHRDVTALLRKLNHPPGKGRTPYLLSTILFPSGPVAGRNRGTRPQRTRVTKGS